MDFVDGKYVGKNIEIVELLATSLHKQVQYIDCPFARCLEMLKKGNADLILGLRITEERQQFLAYINPPYNIQHYPLRFYTNSIKQLAIDSYQDLQSLTIGVMRGATYYDKFDHDTTLNKVEVTSRAQLVNMLLKNRIDTFLEREESIEPLVDEHTYNSHFKLANYQYDNAVGVYMAIAKSSPLYAEVANFSANLKQLQDNGSIGKILAK